jgi:hypothetical protein
LRAHRACNASARTTNDAKRIELPWRTVRYDEKHVVAADGTEVVTLAIADRILQISALELLKRSTITYSKSAQSFEVIEAHTPT